MPRPRLDPEGGDSTKLYVTVTEIQWLHVLRSAGSNKCMNQYVRELIDRDMEEHPIDLGRRERATIWSV